LPLDLTPARILPEDGTAGTLIGRAWLPAASGRSAGPAVVTLRGDLVVDLSAVALTVTDVLNAEDPAALVRAAAGPTVGTVAEMLAASAAPVNPDQPHFLAPCDLQALKAAGVTFVDSLLERVIEEQARGNPAEQQRVREQIAAAIGQDLSTVKPGSEAAARLKETLIARGLWSQYLEVGIGPDAEIFTKAQPMSAVGTGAEIGLHPDSRWSNPEPEVVLAVGAAGRIVGASLGNDVNLRDFEGRSALLLGRSKDNNGSTAIGPFIRLIDGSFGLDDVRQARVRLSVEGEDGFRMEDVSDMARISRDVEELVRHAMGSVHQYPDGMMLFTGTMSAPTQDRPLGPDDGPGCGFTHRLGDIVTIASPGLGALVNRVGTSDRIPPWTYGLRALLDHLAARRAG